MYFKLCQVYIEIWIFSEITIELLLYYTMQIMQSESTVGQYTVEHATEQVYGRRSKYIFRLTMQPVYQKHKMRIPHRSEVANKTMAIPQTPKKTQHKISTCLEEVYGY